MKYGDDRLPQRFWDKVITPDDGCWLWTGAKTRGYGEFSVNRRPRLSHRVAYEALVGPIPSDMEMDHRCRVRHCVNPEHLHPVTHKQNNEHRTARRDSASGIRGVRWRHDTRKWIVEVRHHNKVYRAGPFTDIAEAEGAAIALRNRLFTNNLHDRKAAS